MEHCALLPIVAKQQDLLSIPVVSLACWQTMAACRKYVYGLQPSSRRWLNNCASINIRKLEDSRLADNDVKNIPLRIKENISDILQYSSLY